MILPLLALALFTADPAELLTKQPSYQDASVGRPWSLPLAVAGLEGPLWWEVAEGELPPGVYLVDLSTVLFGAPSGPGLYGVAAGAGQWSFRIKATDASGNSADGWLSVTVSSLVLGQSQIVAPVGQSWEWQAEATGGAAPFRYKLAETAFLPLGLRVTEGGRIAGVAAVAGRYEVPLEVRDAGDNQLKTTLTVAVYGEDTGLPALGVRVAQDAGGGQVELPALPDTLAVTVRWGDGTEEELTSPKATHVYEKDEARTLEVQYTLRETGANARAGYAYEPTPVAVQTARLRR